MVGRPSINLAAGDISERLSDDDETAQSPVRLSVVGSGPQTV